MRLTNDDSAADDGAVHSCDILVVSALKVATGGYCSSALSHDAGQCAGERVLRVQQREGRRVGRVLQEAHKRRVLEQRCCRLLLVLQRDRGRAEHRAERRMAL